MYNVTSQYRQAIKNEVQVTKVRGIIGTIPFNMDNIMRDSFSISNQCTDTNDVVLGSCYIGQLNATFTGIEIARTEWMNKTIVPYFQMWYDSQNFDEIPLGVYTIKEVSHTAEGVEVTAYDNMCKFDKKFKKTGLNMVAHPYDFLTVFCQKCGVSLGMTQNEVEALPNGTANLYLCGVRKSTTTYANDIETYRDALFWLAQCMACFATMDRSGALVLRAYKDSFDDYINDTQRLSGAKFADYITSYTGIYTESLYDGEVTYYGYDLATLQQMRDTAMVQLEQIITDLAELEEEYAQGQITEEEYKAQKKVLTSEKKAKEKYISWLDKMIAQAQSEGDGAYMDLGANPFFQRRDANIPSIADATLATTLRSHILSALGKIEYTPFSCSSVFGVHYDLGDVIQFSGGHADDDLGCIMSYEWTLHGQYNMDGYGIDPDKQNVKDVKNKQSDRAQKNALKSTKNTTGTDTPVSSNNGDMHVDISENSEIQSIYTGGGMTLDSSSGDANSGYNATAHCRDDTQSESIHFRFDNLEVGGTYTMSAYVQIEGDLVNWNSHNFCISCATGDGVPEGAVPNRPDGQVTVLDNGFAITLFYDNQKHYYEGTFTAIASTYYVTVDIAYLKNTWASPPRTYPTHVTECKISEGEAPSDGDPKSVKVYVNGEWKTLKYVNKIKQVQTSSGGTKIATAKNSDGTDTDIYAPTIPVEDVKVDGASVVVDKIANINTMTGATASAAGSKGLVPAPASGDDDKFLRGDGTWQEAGGGTGDCSAIELTAQEYDALTQEEKNDPTKVYYVTDYAGGGSAVDEENSEIITFGAGDNTTSRTFAFDKTPKFISMSWATDSTWRYNGSFPWGADRVFFKALNSATALSGVYVGVSTITYGSDGKSFTITGGNAGGAANTTATNGQIYVEYGGVSGIIVNGATSYSTDEKVVGTWVDGKTLYKKTINPVTSSSSGDQQVVLSTYGISNVDTVCKIEGVALTSAGSVGLNYFYGTGDCFNLYMSSNNTILIMAHYGSWNSSVQTYITLYYTKTS